MPSAYCPLPLHGDTGAAARRHGARFAGRSEDPKTKKYVFLLIFGSSDLPSREAGPLSPCSVTVKIAETSDLHG
jgi:hypothetical protein